jgi:hypothetical protein
LRRGTLASFRLEKRKQARSQSQSKLALKSPCLSVATEESLQVKLPLTPRAPVSLDDPYGLLAAKNKGNEGSPAKGDDATEILEPKSLPTKKGKANFFDKLKKTAKNTDKDVEGNKPQIRIEVTPFDSEQKTESQVQVVSTQDNLGASQTGLLADPLASPTIEHPKKQKNVKQKFELTIESELTENVPPKKSPRRVKVEVSLVEELSALKEELDVFQIQLEGEENEEAREEWVKEIARVSKAIEEKEKQIEQAKHTQMNEAQNCQATSSTYNAITQKDDSEEKKIVLRDHSAGHKADSNPETMVDNHKTNGSTIKLPEDALAEDEKKSSKVEDDSESPSKPKKKSNFH